MRKIILSILGLLLIVAAILLAKSMIANKKRPKPTFNKIIKTVFVENVQNKNIPVIITASGNLLAKNRIELFSEVQGILQMEKAFKAGTSYRKGENLLRINKDEFKASLQSQKSTLFNLITSVIPDIQLDYPKEFSKWKAYLEHFNFDTSTPVLPKFSSNKEKYFISGRGIITGYYAVKNMEVKLGKFEIKAPYNGILTEGLVTRGTLIRAGQKLGEFIDPTVFEIEVSVNASYAELLKIGNTVSVSNLDKITNYIGKIVRVNGKVDLTSQTVKTFIEVKGENLKEGMYLEVDLEAKSETNAIEIPRKLLIDNTSVYIVKNDSILSLIKVNPVFFNKETVVIKGLTNHSKMLTQTVPGAYNGMLVKINKKK
jgi:multidrug efflux pump subunit AcrA (membrane-fusion protein)